MRGIAIGVALLVWAVLAFVIFFFVLLLDEDVNHWNWRRDNGPSALAYTRFVLLSGILAAIPVAGLFWLLAR